MFHSSIYIQLGLKSEIRPKVRDFGLITLTLELFKLKYASSTYLKTQFEIEKYHKFFIVKLLPLILSFSPVLGTVLPLVFIYIQ